VLCNFYSLLQPVKQLTGDNRKAVESLLMRVDKLLAKINERPVDIINDMDNRRKAELEK
jgi:hypothetical protein